MPADSWGHCPLVLMLLNPIKHLKVIVLLGVGVVRKTGDDLTAVNANGDLPLTALLRNVKAGMSTGYYNGSNGSTQSPGTQLSFPHGLSQAPDFVAVSLMDDNGTGSTNTWQA